MGRNLFREGYARLPETIFADLYSDIPSRPNGPMRLPVSLEFLKQNRGWSDEELYDVDALDLQVRYSVGVQQLGETDFDPRTLDYHFAVPDYYSSWISFIFVLFFWGGRSGISKR